VGSLIESPTVTGASGLAGSGVKHGIDDREIDAPA
jgi:hypothetical protein